MNVRQLDGPKRGGSRGGRGRRVAAVSTVGWTLAAFLAVAVAAAPPAGAVAACNANLGAGGGTQSFGRNPTGVLGDGTLISRSAPVDVTDLGAGAGIIDVQASTHSLALANDGTVYAWGRNDLGQLGTGDTATATIPVAVSGLGAGSGVIAISAGGFHSLALKADGSVVAWGSNSNGQLGNNSTTNSLTPVPVNGLGTGSGVTAISAGGFYSLALKSDGSVVSWGSDSNGQLGNNSTVDTKVPGPVSAPGNTGVTAISAGPFHALARKSDGSAIAWGFNGGTAGTSRLGDGTNTDRLVPVPVLTSTGPAVPISGVTAVSAGATHSLALKAGAVFAWGTNGNGQIGNNSTNNTLVAVAANAPGNATVTAISAGGTHSMAVKADGSAIAWGNASDGRLGNGAISGNVLVPSLVAFLGVGAGVLKVAAGTEHGLVVKSGASVAGCGGTPQSAMVGTAYTTVLQAVVRNAANATVGAGVSVTFTAPATGASGSFASPGSGPVAVATTDANGVATAPVFTANNTSGSVVVTVSAPATPSGAAIRLTNTAGPPASIAASAGTPQTAGVGTAFGVDLAAQVNDALGNPAAGSVVTFTAPDTGAGGTFAGGLRVATGTADSRGVATAPVFTANQTVGTYAVTATVPGVSGPATFTLTNSVAVVVNARTGKGYSLVAADGGVFAFGDARFIGSTGATKLNKPIVGMANTPTDKGYWLVASDGGIFSFGDAAFKGSTGGTKLNQPIVGMAPTPSGKGYWLVASDGGIFTYGDATFKGSTGATVLNQPIVGMASTPSGNGYWLVASDGGIFAFGDATFTGSTGATKLNKPIVGMAGTPSGKGYWLVASDGGIFAFGDAGFVGSAGATKLNKPIVGMADTPTGKGYWLVASDGGIFAFGDAKFIGSTGGSALNTLIVGLAAT